MKRLIISGIACPASAWLNTFPIEGEEQIVTVYDTFGEFGFDMPKIIDYVKNKILDYQPDSILCHDFGVPVTLQALLKLLKAKSIPSNLKITFFNGAFRDFNIFKANHPVRFLYTSKQKIISEIISAGGEVGDDFDKIIRPCTKLYTMVVIFSLITQVKKLFKKTKSLDIDFGVPTQMIQSPNDPYIPMSFMKRLQEDFNITTIHEVDYGHFPYSGDIEKISKLLTNFEQ